MPARVFYGWFVVAAAFAVTLVGFDVGALLDAVQEGHHLPCLLWPQSHRG